MRLLLTLALLFPLITSAQVEHFSQMQAREVGPAGMSGRVTSIDVVLRSPNTWYVGTASGGLWMTTSGGTDWTPIFDDQPVASIGDVKVFQNNPDIIWVGTGEGNPRNSQTNGNGVYKSIDGGQTWTHLGLEDSRAIHRMILHPTDPMIAWAGVQGPAWGETEQRGVFKTTDGGKTWTKTLYVNDRTGIGDLVQDPGNPDHLIAAMWEFRRWPWFFESGGEGSGLYVSYDGGETWAQRTHEDGLPKGQLGRMGLAFAPSDPDRVYALVEAEKKNGLYRSDDGGDSWSLVSTENIGNRPFYYADLFVDPNNENRIYNLFSLVTVSEDAGKTFDTLLPYERVHPDHHALWIHPDNSDFIINGNDGGLAVSHDRGDSWRFVENLPLAQFYHIRVDGAHPYNIYGGMQDNGSWRGPAYVYRAGGIRNAYWEEVAFGDGFDTMPDASDPRYGFAMSQGGNLYRYDLETGQRKLVRPTAAGDTTLRFNWDAALAQDPFEPATIYYGSQYVHKSTDRGDTWTVISDDLTTNDPDKQRQIDSGGLTYDVTQAENYTTITAISASPLQENVLWAGTDDGRVHVTQDGGANWTDLTGRFAGVPEGTWVPQIHASRHRAGSAFVLFEDHRRNNWTPYAYETADFGETWTRIVDEDDVYGYVLSIEQDPVEPSLLLLGTEFGLHVSFDAGQTWEKWTHGVPTVSVMDLAIQEREHDLILGTFGRSAYVLDDLRPLRAVAQKGAQTMAGLGNPLTVFETPTAVLATYAQATGTRFAAEAEYAGKNRPYGARIHYMLSEAASADADSASSDTVATIEILEAGEVIRTFKGPARAGVNRAIWNLTRAGERYPSQPAPKTPDSAREPSGPSVLPGTYTVRITRGEHVDSTTVTVEIDPRLDVPDAGLAARDALRRQLLVSIRALTHAADGLRDARKTIDLLNGQLGSLDDATADSLRNHGTAIRDSATALLERINGEEDVKGIRRDPTILNARIGSLNWRLGSSWDTPTRTERDELARLETAVQAHLDLVNAFFATEWPAYQTAIESAGVSPFSVYEPARLE